MLSIVVQQMSFFQHHKRQILLDSSAKSRYMTEAAADHLCCNSLSIAAFTSPNDAARAEKEKHKTQNK